MSVSFGFYNSFEGDRTYDAIQMSSIFDGVISDGVFATVADGLAVTAVAGNRIGVKKGRAWFNHTWTYNDSLYPIDLGPSEILQDRIDAVVLEVNELIRANRILVLEGEPSLETPSAPELTNTNRVHQYPLAYIYRTGGSEAVIQADITNTIGTSACPFVTGVIDTIDIDILVAQWQSQYTSWFAGVQSDMEDYEDQFQEEAEEWFDNMKDQLTTDAAVNLQNQIGNLANLTTTAKNNLVAAVNEAASTGGGGSVTTEPVGQGQYEEPLIQIANGGTGARTAGEAFTALSGWTLDTDTNNTTDTWVPVMIEGNVVQHIVLEDYVLEEGTSGFWTYRKWKSGIAECWGSTTFTDSCNTAWGSLYESGSHYWTYPSGLFSAKPICQAFVYGTSQSAGMLEYITGGSSTRTPAFCVCRPTSVGSQSWTCEMYSIGRWK